MTQDRTWAGLREALTEYRAAEASKSELYRKEKLPHWESCNAYERKERASCALAAAAQAVLDARDAETAQMEWDARKFGAYTITYSTPPTPTEDPEVTPTIQPALVVDAVTEDSSAPDETP